jgi:hypothetical protein
MAPSYKAAAEVARLLSTASDGYELRALERESPLRTMRNAPAAS